MLVSADATGIRRNSVSPSIDAMADNRSWPVLSRCRFSSPVKRIKVERPQAEPGLERPRHEMEAAILPAPRKGENPGGLASLGPRWARGSEPWPVMSARVWDGVRGAGGGKGRAGGSRVSGRWGQSAPGGQAASAGVMVMAQPGLSFSSCRIR